MKRTLSKYGQVWRVTWKFWGRSDLAFNDYNHHVTPSDFYHYKGKNEMIAYVSCVRIK